MYSEDDMDLPYDNFTNYLNNFYSMWPTFVPSFVRVERVSNGQLFSSDHLLTHTVQYDQLSQLNSKRFIRLHMDYNAMWIMPREALISTINESFARWETKGHIRETAASYIIWELKVPALYELDSNGMISEKCHVYHLPNNYVNDLTTPLGKMNLNTIIQLI